jgi:hypothetical protein
MHTKWQKPLRYRTGKTTGIWLATLLAIGLHAIFMLLPIARQIPPVENIRNSIELQLTTLSPPPSPAPVLQRELLPPEKEPEPAELPLADAAPDPLRADAPKQTEVQPDGTDPAPITAVQIARQNKRDVDNMTDLEKIQLMDTVLARQYISEESTADQLFGKLPVQHSTEIRKEFHYPTGPNMIAMLDQPMPDVPFAYTPGLINFAYDPGVKGDLQRFWDVITPEFGWRTKYGTEVKCIMVLVIIGCGWK